MSETILIVDDEESVRRTFREWLEGAQLDCEILAAADAENALTKANSRVIDLAVLDWNLGAGNDGLQLLEDLYVFNPHIVAIMVTGYAHQATPLAAMRMGVRDYLDKNQDLDRDTFLKAVRHQLDLIRPAKRERRLNRVLQEFREALDRVLPLVQSAAAFSDPAPLPQAVRSLFRLLQQMTYARDGVCLIHTHDAARNPPEDYRIFDKNGERLSANLVPFARSVAGAAVSLQSPCAMNNLAQVADETHVELQVFEKERRSLLVAPLLVAPGIQVVFELFDKQADTTGANAEFTDQDARMAGALAEFAAELFRQALSERQTQRVLLDAVAAALDASESLSTSLQTPHADRLEQPPPRVVLERVREGLQALPGVNVDPAESLRLAEAIRVLVVRHGDSAARFCTTLVNEVRALLDGATGVSSDEQPQ